MRRTLCRIIKKVFSFFGIEISRIRASRNNNICENDVKDKKFINVGAGSFNHKHWINVDKVSDFYKKEQKNNTVHWDLLGLGSIPFSDRSIDLIYTSHVIEHITNEAAMNLFSESYRILKKDGIIRLTCPDMKFLFEAYKRGDLSLFFTVRDYGDEESVSITEFSKLEVIDASIQQRFLWSFARQASIHHNRAVNPLFDSEVDRLFNFSNLEDAFNQCVKRCKIDIQQLRPEEHINWWTEDKLEEFLKKAGFGNVLRSRYGQSISPFMRDTCFFDLNAPHNSLYVEAIKD